MKLRKEETLDNPSGYKKQVNVAVSPELLVAFKTKCASYELSMTEVLTDCMLRFIDQQDTNRG